MLLAYSEWSLAQLSPSLFFIFCSSSQTWISSVSSKIDTVQSQFILYFSLNNAFQKYNVRCQISIMLEVKGEQNCSKLILHCPQCISIKLFLHSIHQLIKLKRGSILQTTHCSWMMTILLIFAPVRYWSLLNPWCSMYFVYFHNNSLQRPSNMDNYWMILNVFGHKISKCTYVMDKKTPVSAYTLLSCRSNKQIVYVSFRLV